MGATLLVGAQFGSEGKGVIAHHLANAFPVHVRVGGPNAGHSFMHNGRLWKMRAVPCGFTNKKAQLFIGRGALVAPDVLWKEICDISEGFDPLVLKRIVVDLRAGIIDERHKKDAELSQARERYGSTQEGVGQARVDRVWRDPKFFRFYEDYGGHGPSGDDTVSLVNEAMDHGRDVLVEGTQGFGLSLIHGPWPFTTSHDTTPGQLCADVGISPRVVERIILVARTYPIRVGGNSGPLEREITWEDLSKRFGYSVAERTTVTNRLRRIGEWDSALFRDAVRVCRPTSIALMFMDYFAPECRGMTEFEKLPKRAREVIDKLEDICATFVQFIGTGGDTFAVIDREGWL